ncbi:MAG TPA: DoxX family protein [Flavihumibacter sp.]|nr:DoxX family protein [Bacteroidota bacterium]HQD08267.1 DoxX family protein [Flavihumibacter sp.]
MNGKTKNVVSWILTGLVSFIFLGSGIFKLMGGNPEMAASIGGRTNLIALGWLEIVITALFLFKRTGVVGSLLMIAYMGGAMAVLFVAHQPYIFIIVVQVLIWLAASWRFPELKQRLFNQ